MDTPIKLQYTPEKKDYIRVSRLLAMKTPSFFVLAIIILLLVVAAVVILVIPSIGNPAWRNIAAVVCMMGGFYIIYYLVLIPLQLSKAYRVNANLRQKRYLTFTDEKIIMRIDEQSLDLEWENVQKVIDGRLDYLLIYKGEGNIYPFVPKRSFADQATRDAFLELLDRKSILVA